MGTTLHCLRNLPLPSVNVILLILFQPVVKRAKAQSSRVEEHCICTILYQLKLKPPGSENAVIDNFVPILKKGRYKIGKLPEEREAEEREREEKERREKEAKNRNPKRDF